MNHCKWKKFFFIKNIEFFDIITLENYFFMRHSYSGSKIFFNDLIKYDLDLLDCAYTIHGRITDSAKCTDKSIEKNLNSDQSGWPLA